jgi:hypothetical protein
MPKHRPPFEALAKRYRISARTLRRLHERGVNIEDAAAVAAALAMARQAAPAALEAVAGALEHELSAHE